MPKNLKRKSKRKSIRRKSRRKSKRRKSKRRKSRRKSKRRKSKRRKSKRRKSKRRKSKRRKFQSKSTSPSLGLRGSGTIAQQAAQYRRGRARTDAYRSSGLSGIAAGLPQTPLDNRPTHGGDFTAQNFNEILAKDQTHLKGAREQRERRDFTAAINPTKYKTEAEAWEAYQRAVRKEDWEKQLRGMKRSIYVLPANPPVRPEQVGTAARRALDSSALRRRFRDWWDKQAHHGVTRAVHKHRVAQRKEARAAEARAERERPSPGRVAKLSRKHRKGREEDTISSPPSTRAAVFQWRHLSPVLGRLF